jgi:predicted ATP-dependent serine protease
LELHQLLTSCLDNQLTYVHGAKGLGKSALVLEAATYLRQRGAFPHGIFVCSLEGLRKTDRVRAQVSGCS